MAALLSLIYLCLAVALGLFLVARFRATRERGLIMLAVGLGLWPFVSSIISFGIRSGVDRALQGGSVPFPFSMLSDGRMSAGEFMSAASIVPDVVQMALVLVGLVLLLRGRRVAPPNSVMEPTAHADRGDSAERLGR